MPKSEHLIQDEIRRDVSANCPGIIFRCNAGEAWGGKRVWSEYYGCYIIKDPRPIKLLPEGFSDLLYFGPKNDTVFVEVKNEKGKVREAQARFLALMERLGFRVCVARSADDAVSFINSREK